MIISWESLFDEAAVSVDFEEEATLPAANVQHPHLSRQCHSPSTVNAARFLFDLGSAQSLALVALLGTNLTPAATVRIRCKTADSDVTTSPLYDSTAVDAGVKTLYGASYKGFTPVSARYWGIDISDASLDHLEIGRIWGGASWTSAINQDLGWGITPVDPSMVVRSAGGQAFSDRRPISRRSTFNLNWLTKTEAYENALVMALTNGRTSEIIAINDLADAHLSEEAVYGLCEIDEPILNRLLNVWSRKFSILESH